MEVIRTVFLFNIVDFFIIEPKGFVFMPSPAF